MFFNYNTRTMLQYGQTYNFKLAMEQEQINKAQLPFNCLQCQRSAHMPVLTPCGHLYCWRCFFLLNEKNSPCLICKTPLSQDQVYPLFIEHEERDQQQIALPQRPPPKHIPKIPNSDIISSRNNNLRDNIAMGRPLAGMPFTPGLGVLAWSQLGDIGEHQPQKPVSFCLKFIFTTVLTILVVLFCVQLIL